MPRRDKHYSKNVGEWQKWGAQRFLFYLCAPKLLFVYKRFWIEIDRPLLVLEIVDKDLEA